MKKKLLSVFLITLGIGMLNACGGAPEAAPDEAQREQKQTAKKKKVYTLTERDGSKAALRKGVTVAQATRKLAAYEATGLSPQEVFNLMEREQNLTRRIEKLESWEE